MAVNPGTIIKGATGGTFAVIQVHPLPVERLRQIHDAGPESSVTELEVVPRMSVTIRRI